MANTKKLSKKQQQQLDTLKAIAKKYRSPLGVDHVYFDDNDGKIWVHQSFKEPCWATYEIFDEEARRRGQTAVEYFEGILKDLQAKAVEMSVWLKVFKQWAREHGFRKAKLNKEFLCFDLNRDYSPMEPYEMEALYGLNEEGFRELRLEYQMYSIVKELRSLCVRHSRKPNFSKHTRFFCKTLLEFIEKAGNTDLIREAEFFGDNDLSSEDTSD